jgi:hypothetical protein
VLYHITKPNPKPLLSLSSATALPYSINISISSLNTKTNFQHFPTAQTSDSVWYKIEWDSKPIPQLA